MKVSIITAALAVCGLVVFSGFAQADELTRRPAGAASGSGDTVEANCGGPDYQDAKGTIDFEGNKVNIEIEGAVPNTHFTVWTRIKGSSNAKDINGDDIPFTGYNPGGSPWTGGGATPLCSGTEFASLNANSPWNNALGSSAPLCNSFSTNPQGKGKFKTSLNFNPVGGAYPFQQAGGAVAHPTKGGAADVPTAIVDPRTGNGGPFLIRVVSHCTDNSNHGLSPATREAFFQYP